MASGKKYPLPVCVSDDVLDKNPKFSLLLRLLSSKLTQTGVTMETKQEMEMAEKNVCLARQGWLMNQLPFYELRELVTDMEIKSMEGTLSLEEEQLTEVLSQAVAVRELGDYLRLPSTSPSHQSCLLGLSLEDLDRHDPTKQTVAAVQRAVLPVLEERLVRKHQDLVAFCSPHTDSAAGLEVAGGQGSLPSLVEESKQRLSRGKVQLKLLTDQRRESFLLYYQTLLQCLSSMERLLRHHKLEVQSASDKMAVEWMEAWCVAVCTRAKLTLLELDCDTYTAKTAAALKVIRGHLDAAIGESERELEATRHQLTAYRAVGSEFKSLVDQYTALKKEIDDCSWGLQHFASADSQPH